MIGVQPDATPTINGVDHGEVWRQADRKRAQRGCVRTESKFLEKNHSEILELSDPQPQFYEVVINNSLNIAVFLK